ncbi:MAG: hypothetical protein ACRCW2_09200 [Cellulosilyticaceae bacterium]
MGQYRIITSPPKRTIFIKVEGIFGIWDADQFIIDFDREISKLNPKEYTLSFDCTYLGVTGANTLFKLEACFKRYYQADFLNVTFDTGGNPLLFDQLTQLSRRFRLPRYEVI